MSYNYFKKKKWTEEQEAWLVEHKSIRGKKLMYDAFMERFPEATFTPEAISSKRTEIGAYDPLSPRDRYRNAAPLYSERVKKGYVLIKVSACEWWPKQKWVWVATHPGEEFSIRNQFVFLDCNNRNFAPDNIRNVTHAIMGLVNRSYGGFIPGQPDLNRALIAKAELTLAMYDAGEKNGLTCNYGVGRMFISERNEKARERRKNMTPEQRARRNEKAKEYCKRRRAEDPEYARRYREYRAQWARNKRRADSAYRERCNAKHREYYRRNHNVCN